VAAPPSRMLRIADGTLAPDAKAGWPKIPGVQHSRGLPKMPLAALLASAMCGFVRMTRVGAHMGLMEGVEARSGAPLEVVGLVSNEGATGAARIVKGVIVAPVSVVQRAIIAVIIPVIVYRSTRAACTGAR